MFTFELEVVFDLTLPAKSQSQSSAFDSMTLAAPVAADDAWEGRAAETAAGSGEGGQVGK